MQKYSTFGIGSGQLVFDIGVSIMGNGFINFIKERRIKKSKVDNTIGASIIGTGFINSKQKRGIEK